jgi:hypothetical protein
VTVIVRFKISLQGLLIKTDVHSSANFPQMELIKGQRLSEQWQTLQLSVTTSTFGVFGPISSKSFTRSLLKKRFVDVYGTPGLGMIR